MVVKRINNLIDNVPGDIDAGQLMRLRSETENRQRDILEEFGQTFRGIGRYNIAQEGAIAIIEYNFGEEDPNIKYGCLGDIDYFGGN